MSKDESVQRLRAEDPSERQLTKRQIQYLSAETGLDVEELAELRVGDVAEKLKWHLDFELLFYRRVCGRVVKTDPVTGEQKGVPYATVHVEDTDCAFLGLFPVEDPLYWWLWLVSCDRELIATVTTDECGNFCVNIPRWDIDRILRFRKQRVCLPEIIKPRLPDLLERYRIPPHPPLPDPPPFLNERLGRLVQDARKERHFGDEAGPSLDLAVGNITPPMDPDVVERASAVLPNDVAREFKKEEALRLTPDRAIGPFLRCHEMYVAEWVYAFEVPDITFRVTQDVDGDGNEETIYDEGLFDVRWNDSSAGPVVLEASSIARATDACDLPLVECEDKPALLAVGRMPTTTPFMDPATGYALLTNQPRLGGIPTGVKNPPAASPFRAELQLSGCYDIDGAAFFRVTYEHGGVAAVPFIGLSWYSATTVPPFWMVMSPVDTDGWYAVSDAQQQSDPHWVLNWPATARGPGEYMLRLEVADSSKTILDTSDPVSLVLDDRHPNVALMSVLWKPSTVGGWTGATELVGQTCPVIMRGPGADIDFRVTWSATAEHFRNATLWPSGCGAGAPATTSGDTVYWHETPSDSGVTKTAYFSLASGKPQGSYGFHLESWSRAFSPAGSAGPAVGWNFDPSHAKSQTSIRFAVIDM